MAGNDLLYRFLLQIHYYTTSLGLHSISPSLTVIRYLHSYSRPILQGISIIIPDFFNVPIVIIN